MLSFIYNYQSILILGGLILVLFISILAIKKMPTKVVKKKKEDKNSEKVEMKPEEKAEKPDILPEDLSEIEDNKKTQDDEEKIKKQDKKPKIVQIYKRSERKDSTSNQTKQDLDPIYNRNIEFVNTSKNIAKFKSFVEDKVDVTENEEDKKDDFGFVLTEKEDCEFCEDKVKHFDHTKRLSSVMKDDGDIFASHISDKYLNINSERHLNLEKLESLLNKRTEDMLKNSLKKVDCECEHEECDNGVCEECEDMPDDDVKVDMKTALIAETYFKRKSRR